MSSEACPTCGGPPLVPVAKALEDMSTSRPGGRGSGVLIRPHLIYQRLAQRGKGSIGLWVNNAPDLTRLPLGGFGWGVEDPHRDLGDKVMGETRIPGSTRYFLRRRTWGGKFERYKQKFGHDFIAEVYPVPNFTDVLIHIANFVTDTEGCLNIGRTVNDLFAGRPTPSIGKSTDAYIEFYEAILVPLFDTVEKPILDVHDESYLFDAWKPKDESPSGT